MKHNHNNHRIDIYTMEVYEEIKKYELILCSSSPRRKDILKQIGFDPIIIKSKFAEDLEKSKYNDPIKYVEDTSFYKIMDIYENIHNINNNSSNNLKPKILLSADTVIICNNKIFEKPLNFENNVKMIKELRNFQKNGYKILIVTYCTLIKILINGKFTSKKFKSISEIHLIDNLSDLIIEEYCKSGEGLEVAGGFKIQGKGAILFDFIKGDFYNCVGLPASLVFEQISEIIND